MCLAVQGGERRASIGAGGACKVGLCRQGFGAASPNHVPHPPILGLTRRLGGAFHVTSSHPVCVFVGFFRLGLPLGTAVLCLPALP